AEAKRLGVRVAIHDRLARGEGSPEDELRPGQGRPVRIEEVDPWPTPVDGGQVLDEMSLAQRKYMVMSEMQADAVTLWTARTHAQHGFEFNPLRGTKPVEKRSGKTRQCETAERGVAKPLLVSSASAPAILRIIEMDRPTIIIDEFDALMKKSPEM